MAVNGMVLGFLLRYFVPTFATDSRFTFTLMSNRRRVIIITISVFLGTLLSAAMLLLKRGGSLDNHDYFLLATNLTFSLVIIFAIGYFLVWRKKD